MRLNTEQQYGYNRYLDYLHYKASEIFSLQMEAEDRVRQDEKNEIARKLINLNLSDEDIAEATGLTLEQIQELRKQK
jgi:hypothetical protein